MPDFTEIVVGVHGGYCTVEVGIHHGLDTTYEISVTDDNYLGWRFLDAVGNIRHGLRLDLEEFFGLTDCVRNFPHIEMVPDVDIGIHTAIFQELNESAGKVQRNGGFTDYLVCDGVGRQGALVGNDWQSETQFPAKGDGRVGRTSRCEGHSGSRFQYAGYCLPGTLGERGVGMTIEERAVDV